MEDEEAENTSSWVMAFAYGTPIAIFIYIMIRGFLPWIN